ncbi:hypothetical protein [Roseateles sp. P5_D6]
MSGEALQLEEPLKEGGIRSVNFFNGRLLTGKDMSREQQARREWDARLGLAIGDGVAFGLETARDADLDTAAAPVLRVKSGLAVNRAGQTLRLSLDTSVALTRRFDTAGTTACDCVFANCNPLGDGTYVAGAGVYLLTIAPAQMSEGRAPTNGLDPTNVRCNTDVTVDGLQFRLLSINPLRYVDLDLGTPQFRNRLAYRCFGVEARAANALDPWRNDPPKYGLVDELRGTSLSDCDVPLALVYWTAAGLQFVDTWAVRRMLLAPDALNSLAFQARDRRLVEAHAMCAQFQQHLSDLLAATSNPTALLAIDHFRHLPPFGTVPLQSLPLRGFFEPSFLFGIVRRPGGDPTQGIEFIDARLMSVLQEQALAHAPIDLTQKEFIWLYRPWQNVKAATEGVPVQPMLVFATGLLPELALARFDMARFDFSNYANCCGSAA